MSVAASSSGSNNTTIAVNGDGNVVLVSQRRELTFRRPTRLEVKAEIDLLKSYEEAIPFLGREREFDLLNR